MDLRRLFIAIQLNDETRESVRETQAAFRRQGVRGNYTPAENLHLTLAFIGEYGDPDSVLDAMETVRFSPFSLTMDLNSASLIVSPNFIIYRTYPTNPRHQEYT